MSSIVLRIQNRIMSLISNLEVVTCQFKVLKWTTNPVIKNIKINNTNISMNLF